MATKQPKPPKATVYATNTGKGISSLFEMPQTKNFQTDRGRNLLNLGGSIGNWFASRADPKYGPGDYAYGINPKSAAPVRKNVDNTLPGTGSPTTYERTDRPVEPSWSPEPPPAKTLADYMAQARGMATSDGTNYDALSGQLRANGASGDAKLAAMYDALARSTAGDAAGIQANFDNTGSKMAASSAAASSSAAAGFQATQAAQAAQFKALGIENAAGTLASNGAQAARDQNIAQSNIAQNSAANQNQNTARAGNAQQYNTGVVQSNRSAGVEARSKLQQQLSSKLAELESAKASSQSTNSRDVFNMALQLMQTDSSNPANQLSAQNAAQDRQLMIDGKTANIQKVLAETTNMGSKQTLQQTLAGSTGAYQKIVKLAAANNVNTGDTKAMSSFIQSLVAAGKLG